MAQAGSFVPARERQAADRRPHLRARRRVGQHRARPVDVHGRDAGDRQHPAHRHVAQPGDPRRDRPRHGTFDGLSLAWAVAEHLASNRTRAAQDDLRHALPRAHRPGRRAAGRRELPRRGARVEGRHRVPAQDRRRADPTAATASRSRGSPGCRRRSSSRAREILNGLERDELSRGGRPSLSGRRRDAATARPVPGARADRAIHVVRHGCARSTSTT